MSSPSPSSSNELSTMSNKGSADSPPDNMAPAEDSPPDTALLADRITRFIEAEGTTPTGLLPVETQDAEQPSPTTTRIESTINAFDDVFGDDRNGTAEQENDEEEGDEGDDEEKDEDDEDDGMNEGNDEDDGTDEGNDEEGREDETK